MQRQDKGQQALDPAQLQASERAFLDALLDRTISILTTERRDAADEILLAYALFLAGRDAESHTAYDAALKAPRGQREQLYTAVHFLMTGKPTRAIAEFDRAINRGQAPFFSTVMGVEAMTMAGQYGRAERELDRLRGLFPDEAIVEHTRGHLASAQGHWSQSVESYEAARRMGSENPDLDEGIAASWIELGDFEKASEAISRCRQGFPDYAEILFQELRVAVATGDDRTRTDELFAEYRERTLRWQRLREIEILLNG